MQQVGSVRRHVRPKPRCRFLPGFEERHRNESEAYNDSPSSTSEKLRHLLEAKVESIRQRLHREEKISDGGIHFQEYSIPRTGMLSHKDKCPGESPPFARGPCIAVHNQRDGKWAPSFSQDPWVLSLKTRCLYNQSTLQNQWFFRRLELTENYHLPQGHGPSLLPFCPCL